MNNYTREDILRMVEEEDVGFIRLQFTDIFGTMKNIAIPHGKSASVKKIGVAIGVTAREIPWETLDGKGVKGIILFAVGNDNEGAKTHLKLLSLFARKLGNDEVVEQLIKAKETKEVIAAFAS